MSFESDSNGESSSFRLVETRSVRDRYKFMARSFKQIYLQLFELGHLAGWD